MPMQIEAKGVGGGVGCCHICPRDSFPRRPWSKGTTVQWTVVQGDFGQRRLLSKEAFTSEKLVKTRLITMRSKPDYVEFVLL